MTNNSGAEMINPFLRRAVWLSQPQRALLLEAATSAKSNSKSDTILCNSVILEIERSEREFKNTKKSNLINTVINGLRLPKNSLPVYLCYAEVSEIKKYTKVDITSIDANITWENGK
jgi:hypothetical protein